MRTRRIILIAAWGLGLLALAAGVVTWLRQPLSAGCTICQRPIHANTHVVALVDGRQIEACCPRCVLTVREQDGKDARLLQVSDYLTARPLRPAAAYYVEGSAVEVCSSPRLRSYARRTVFERRFDRCAPSLLAFAKEEQARAFMAENGGALKRLEDLLGKETGPAAPAERSKTP